MSKNKILALKFWFSGETYMQMNTNTMHRVKRYDSRILGAVDAPGRKWSTLEARVCFVKVGVMKLVLKNR